MSNKKSTATKGNENNEFLSLYGVKSKTELLNRLSIVALNIILDEIRDKYHDAIREENPDEQLQWTTGHLFEKAMQELGEWTPEDMKMVERSYHKSIAKWAIPHAA